MKNGLIVDYFGTKCYYINNLLHRVDGPAMEYSNGNKSWWLNGVQHRVDGPAQEMADGSKYWFLNGKCLIHPEEFENMESWFEKLNDNEEYSLSWINDINGNIEFIKNPTDKQKRLNAMKWNI